MKLSRVHRIVRDAASTKAAFVRLSRQIEDIKGDLRYLAHEKRLNLEQKNRYSHSVLTRIEHSAFFKFVVLLGILGGAVTLFNLYWESEHRKFERVASAWQMLAATGSGNLGKKTAIEFLNTHDCFFGSAIQRDTIISAFSYWVRPSRCSFVWKSPSFLDWYAMRDAHSERATFEGIDLSPREPTNYTELSGIWLHSANFSRANLTNVNFLQSVFVRTLFRDGILNGSNFNSSSISDSELLMEASCATFRDVNIKESKIGGTFRYTDLSKAKITKSSFHFIDFTGSLIDWTIIKDASVSNSNFTGTFINKSWFKDVLFTATKFNDADLSGTIFESCEFNHYDEKIHNSFSGANLSAAQFRNTKFENVDLAGSYFCKGSPPDLGSYEGTLPEERICDIKKNPIEVIDWGDEYIFRIWSEKENTECGIISNVFSKFKWQ